MGQPIFPRSAFDRGQRFLEADARTLDRARLAWSLGTANAHAVLDALAAYQNHDGGFAHGLEPDLRSPMSTAIATSVGLRVLREIDAPAHHPMVGRAINWLLAEVDSERFVWPIVTPAAAQAPHAPWWDFDDDMEAKWNGYRYNPSADLFGALCHWRSLVADELLANMTSDFSWRLQNNPPSAIYDLYCCLRLQESRNVPERIRASLEDAIVKAAAAQDPGSFHVNYFELVPSPTSLLYSSQKENLENAVCRAVDTQGEDGGWHPPWDWGEVNAEAWSAAQREWSGVLTRTVLETVHRHGLVG
jgi:hypothetical protein